MHKVVCSFFCGMKSNDGSFSFCVSKRAVVLDQEACEGGKRRCVCVWDQDRDWEAELWRKLKQLISIKRETFFLEIKTWVSSESSGRLKHRSGG